MKKEDTYVECPYYRKDGKRPDRCRWQGEGGERVAAVGGQRSRFTDKETPWHRNRSADKEPHLVRI